MNRQARLAGSVENDPKAVTGGQICRDARPWAAI